jgi:4-hydroxybenzoate polyprenyltransferase
MTSSNAIIRLMRLDKPVGTYLLWFPTAWALWLSRAPLNLYIWFALGTFVMRSAGCVINDIADRRVDGFVKRTQYRPLANQSISLWQAWLLFIGLLLVALCILIQLPQHCFYGALPAAGLTLLYPFCKRFFVTPQLILSLAFASSIPMVFLASPQSWNLSWTLLIFLTICWVVAYDTEYAMVDIQDDMKVGIQSSARFFGPHVIPITMVLLSISHVSWLGIAMLEKLHAYFYIGWLLGAVFIGYQFLLLQQKKPFKAFLSNTYYGLWIWILLLSNLSA